MTEQILSPWIKCPQAQMAHQTVTAIDTRLSTVETVVAIEREENHVQTDFDCFVPGIYFGRPVPCARLRASPSASSGPS